MVCASKPFLLTPCIGMQPPILFLSLLGWASSLPLTAWHHKKIIHWIPLYLHLYNAVWALLWNTDPRVALLDDWACASSTWLSASFSPPEELCRSVLLPTGHEESMYPHPCQHLALRSFLIVVSLIGIKGDVIVLVSMITPEFEHLYRCLWAFWVFLLYKLPVDVFYPLF